jgi:trk system potassium uptake protein TrkH
VGRNWQPRPGDMVVRHPRQAEIRSTTLNLPLPRVPTRGLASPVTLLYGFAFLVILGTGLLLLPSSTDNREVAPWLVALFTATSAITVTGLTVVDTPTYWSATGHGIILGLILIGGLGWMSFAGFVLILLGQRISLPQRLALRESLGTAQVSGVLMVLKYVVLSSILLQLLGGGVLTLRLRMHFGWEWPQAVWQGMFHAVSGFNGAGFTILPADLSLAPLASDAIGLCVMAFLIILGGLSFPVLGELLRVHRFSRYSLDTKMVLSGSLVLWALGAAVVFTFEFTNEATMGLMNFGDKVLNSFFHSVSARAAGFSTIDLGLTTPATAFFITALMFIGTASASTGGGIRINTLGVIVATVLASVRGRRYVTTFGREISPVQVQRAVAISGLAVLMVFFTAFLLTFTEHGNFIDLLFEAVSAVGTVGLSTGVTSELSLGGRILIMLTMLVGRMGPLSLMLTLVSREQRPPLYRFAGERVKIG